MCRLISSLGRHPRMPLASIYRPRACGLRACRQRRAIFARHAPRRRPSQLRPWRAAQSSPHECRATYPDRNHPAVAPAPAQFSGSNAAGSPPGSARRLRTSQDWPAASRGGEDGGSLEAWMQLSHDVSSRAEATAAYRDYCADFGHTSRLKRLFQRDENGMPALMRRCAHPLSPNSAQASGIER
jgi:hypothetical protein